MKRLLFCFVLSVFLLFGCATSSLSPPDNITGTIYECEQLLCDEYIEREKAELRHYIDNCGHPAVLGMQQGVVTALISRCDKLEEKDRNKACKDFDSQNKWLDGIFDRAYDCEKP